MGAHVFRKGLMRTMTDIQTAEIHSYGQGKAFFHPARDSLHETPHCLAQNWEDGYRGWERHSYHTPAAPGIARNSDSAPGKLRPQKSVTSAEKSKYHLAKFLGNLSVGCNASRTSTSQQPNCERDCNSVSWQRYGRQSFFRADQDGVAQPSRRGHHFAIRTLRRTGTDPSQVGYRQRSRGSCHWPARLSW